MNFNISEHDKCAVIQFNGELMGGPEAVHLNRELHKLIDKGQINIVADAGGIKLMNSSGLGMLIGGLTTMRKAGGDLRIANPTDKIQNLLVITKLHSVFRYYDSLEEAIKSFQDEVKTD
jgi:anti-sigma B factor antagonist